MALNKKVQSFLAISEAFLMHTADSLPIDDGGQAAETLVMAYAPDEAVRECIEPLR